ncbi:MAG TPA: hypothetical protein VJ876_03430, partial [Bacteroidales bacterium]|nr:hypothetical protein [Bacteroidales bacterium]
MKNAFIRTVLIVLSSLVVAVLIAFLAWLLKPSHPLEVFILNKTVPTQERREHQSFHWMLNHEKYVKQNKSLYDLKEDYYGFFPIQPEKQQFDFRSLSLRDVETISDRVDVAYYIDTYGVYYNDWYTEDGPYVSGDQKVYGGLNQNDYLLLKALKEKGKTILTEFVLLDKSASGLVRKKTEDLLHLRWDGWIGKYFPSLQSDSCPSWIMELYKSQNQGNWPFTGSGVVLIHKYGKVVILDNKKHLKKALPVIHTKSRIAKQYNLPDTIPYTNWFDIIQTDSTGQVLATFNLKTTAAGDSLLENYRMKADFPAITHHAGDYRFYYFAGDFSHNDISTTTSYFEGAQLVDFLFHGQDHSSSSYFFWRYYRPLIHG